MKTFTLAACIAGAAMASPVQPPVISLDLSSFPSTEHSSDTLWGGSTHLHKITKVETDHCDSTMGNKLWQEVVVHCEAGKATQTNCKTPGAKAKDHHDTEVQVVQKVYLLDEDGTDKVNGQDCGTLVDADKVGDTAFFSKRRTYLYTFDAEDLSGNKATSLAYTLVLDDTTKPDITQCSESSTTVEAASDWTMCHSDTVSDNCYPNSPEPDNSEICKQSSLPSRTLTSALKYQVAYPALNNLCPAVSFDDDLNAYTGGCTGAEAAAKITTLQTGTFTVTTYTADNAKAYGKDHKSNTKTETRTIEVEDTTPPVITITDQPTSTNTKPAAPSTTNAVHECAKQYEDAGATASDQLDNANGDAIEVTVANSVPAVGIGAPAVGTYNVKYNAQDQHGLTADEQTRTVQVTDTTDPKVDLVANAQEELDPITHRADKENNSVTDPGVTCVDTCDKGDLTITTSWGNKNWDPQVVGSYVRTYTCKDAAHNADSKPRTFVNVDEDAPIIVLNKNGRNEQGHVTEEAVPIGEYTDPGAVCTDYHHHPVTVSIDSHDHTATGGSVNADDMFALNFTSTSEGGLTISGDVVDLSTPGDYTITYQCKDQEGNDADPVSRTVTVEDTEPPSCVVTGDQTVTIEAGFKYTDEGASATDTLDDDTALTDTIWKTVTVSEGDSDSFDVLASDEGSSFGDSNDVVELPRVGKFVIQYHVKDNADNSDDGQCKRTVIVQDTLAPVITLHDAEGNVIHKSDGSDTGVNGVANPANTAEGNEHFMAEARSDSESAWVILGAASAITGLALLAASAKRSATTAVPV